MSVYRTSPSWCILTLVIALRLVLRILAVTAVSFVLSFLSFRGDMPWQEGYFKAVSAAKDAVPVARELLLVQEAPSSRARTGVALDPVELIWTLAEFRADRVLVTRSFQSANGPSRDSAELDPEFEYRLDQEFSRIDDNIVALFEAIRIGSIEPSEADRFLQQLRQLVTNSKNRVEDGLRQSAGDGVSLEDLIGTFGNDRLATDLRDLGVALPSYPWAETLPAPPRGDDGPPGFRRLPYSSLRRYNALIDQFDLRLASLEEAGYFEEAAPRRRPSVMREHARSLRRELYENPTERRVVAWREARDGYFETVAGLIDSDSEARLIEPLGTLQETDDLEEESATEIKEMQNELASAFATLRSEYAVLSALRNELAQAIGGSFVIVDDVGVQGESVPGGAGFVLPSDVLTEGERRAIVANSVLVGEHLRVPIGWYRTLLLTGVGFVIGIMLAPLRAGVAIALSPVLALLLAALFPALFVVADIWIDPASPVTVLAGAVIAAVVTAVISQQAAEQTVAGRGAYRLPPRMFRRTIRRGSLPAHLSGRRRAAVVAIAPESRGEVSELSAFHGMVSRKIRRLGGIVAGEEGHTVFAVFETLPEEGPVLEGSHPTGDARSGQSVCAAVKRLVSTNGNEGMTLRCGVEVGELVFYVSPLGGFRATGRPMTYARHLCHLSHKHHCRALFGAGLVSAHQDESEEMQFQETGKLAATGGGGAYVYYSLKEIDPPSL